MATDVAAEWVPTKALVPWDENPRINDQSVDEVGQDPGPGALTLERD